jgi:hypothetical protein
MFESIVGEILSRYLSTYISDFDPSKLSLGIWGGDVKLENLTLDPYALAALDLPIALSSGSVGKIVLKIPWKSLSSSPVQVEVADVSLVFAPLSPEAASERLADPEKLKAKRVDAKLAALDQAEMNAKMLKEAEQGNDGKGGGASYVSSLVETIVANLQVSVRNIHVRIQSMRGSQLYSIGFCLESFDLFTTDESGTRTFVATPGALQHKQGRVEGLVLYIQPNAPDLVGKKQVLAEMASGSHITRREMLLSPTSIFLSIQMKKRDADFATPELMVTGELPDLSLRLEDAQFRSLMSLTESLSAYNVAVELVGLRPDPSVRPTDDPRAWWAYAIEMIRRPIQERARRRSMSYFIENCRKRKRYIPLYKRRLGAPGSHPLKEEEKKVVRDIERELDLHLITLFRSFAAAEVELEVKAAIAAGKPTGPAQEKKGWLSGLMSWGHKSDAAEKSESLISDEERKQLYASLDVSAASKVSALPADFVQQSFSFVLGELSFSLAMSDPGRRARKSGKGMMRRDAVAGGDDEDGGGELGSREILRTVTSRIVVSAAMRPESSMIADLSIGNFEVRDGATTNTVYPRVVYRSPLRVDEQGSMSAATMDALSDTAHSGDLLSLTFEQKPLSRVADMCVAVRMEPLDVVVSLPFLEAVGAFFAPPAGAEDDDVDLSVVNELAGSYAQFAQQATKEQLAAAVEDHKTMDIDVDIVAPYLIVPEDTSSLSCVTAIVQLGRFRVKSVLAPPAGSEADDDDDDDDKGGNDSDSKASYKKKKQSKKEKKAMIASDAKFYDRFEVSLSEGCVLLATFDKSWWLHAEQNATDLRIIDDFCVTLLLEMCIDPNEATLAKMKVGLDVKDVIVRYSPLRHGRMMRLVRALTATAAGGKEGAPAPAPAAEPTATPAGAASTSDEGSTVAVHRAEQDEATRKVLDRRVEVYAVVIVHAVKLVIERDQGDRAVALSDAGRTLLESSVHGLRVQFTKFTYNSEALVTLTGMHVRDCAAGQELLSTTALENRDGSFLHVAVDIKAEESPSYEKVDVYAHVSLAKIKLELGAESLTALLRFGMVTLPAADPQAAIDAKAAKKAAKKRKKARRATDAARSSAAGAEGSSTRSTGAPADVPLSPRRTVSVRGSDIVTMKALVSMEGVEVLVNSKVAGDLALVALRRVAVQQIARADDSSDLALSIKSFDISDERDDASELLLTCVDAETDVVSLDMHTVSPNAGGEYDSALKASLRGTRLIVRYTWINELLKWTTGPSELLSDIAADAAARAADAAQQAADAIVADPTPATRMLMHVNLAATEVVIPIEHSIDEAFVMRLGTLRINNSFTERPGFDHMLINLSGTSMYSVVPGEVPTGLLPEVKVSIELDRRLLGYPVADSDSSANDLLIGTKVTIGEISMLLAKEQYGLMLRLLEGNLYLISHPPDEPANVGDLYQVIEEAAQSESESESESDADLPEDATAVSAEPAAGGATRMEVELTLDRVSVELFTGAGAPMDVETCVVTRDEAAGIVSVGVSGLAVTLGTQGTSMQATVTLQQVFVHDTRPGVRVDVYRSILSVADSDSPVLPARKGRKGSTAVATGEGDDDSSRSSSSGSGMKKRRRKRRDALISVSVDRDDDGETKVDVAIAAIRVIVAPAIVGPLLDFTKVEVNQTEAAAQAMAAAAKLAVVPPPSAVVALRDKELESETRRAENRVARRRERERRHARRADTIGKHKSGRPEVAQTPPPSGKAGRRRSVGTSRTASLDEDDDDPLDRPHTTVALRMRASQFFVIEDDTTLSCRLIHMSLGSLSVDLDMEPTDEVMEVKMDLVAAQVAAATPALIVGKSKMPPVSAAAVPALVAGKPKDDVDMDGLPLVHPIDVSLKYSSSRSVGAVGHASLGRIGVSVSYQDIDLLASIAASLGDQADSIASPPVIQDAGEDPEDLDSPAVVEDAQVMELGEMLRLAAMDGAIDREELNAVDRYLEEHKLSQAEFERALASVGLVQSDMRLLVLAGREMEATLEEIVSSTVTDDSTTEEMDADAAPVERLTLQEKHPGASGAVLAHAVEKFTFDLTVFSVTLVNDAFGRNQPFLGLRVNSLCGSVANWSSNMKAAISGGIVADYYNAMLVSYEPLLESWTFQVLYDMKPSPQLQLLSDCRLDLTVSEAFLDTVARTSIELNNSHAADLLRERRAKAAAAEADAAAGAGVSDKDVPSSPGGAPPQTASKRSSKSTRTSASTRQPKPAQLETELSAAEASMRRRQELQARSPFRLTNDFGRDVEIRVYDERVHTSVPPGEDKYIKVVAGATVPIRVPNESSKVQDLCHYYLDVRLRMPEDVRDVIVLGVSMDTVGVTSKRMDELLVDQEIPRAWKLAGIGPRLLFRVVESEPGVKTMILRSAVRVRNASSLTLKLRTELGRAIEDITGPEPQRPHEAKLAPHGGSTTLPVAMSLLGTVRCIGAIDEKGCEFTAAPVSDEVRCAALHEMSTRNLSWEMPVAKASGDEDMDRPAFVRVRIIPLYEGSAVYPSSEQMHALITGNLPDADEDTNGKDGKDDEDVDSRSFSTGPVAGLGTSQFAEPCGYDIILTDPVVLLNESPFFLTLHMGTEKRVDTGNVLDPSTSHMVNRVDPTERQLVIQASNVSMHGVVYPKVAPTTVRLCNKQDRFSIAETLEAAVLQITDEFGQTFALTIEPHIVEHTGAIVLRLHAPVIVINRTGLPLVWGTSSREMGAFVSPRKGHSTEVAVPYSIGTQPNCKGKLRVAVVLDGAKLSSWSSSFNLDTLGASGRVTLVSKETFTEYWFHVRIQLVGRQRQVIISNEIELWNAFKKRTLLYRQAVKKREPFNTVTEAKEAAAANRIAWHVGKLKPGERRAFHWSTDRGNLHMAQVRVADKGAPWGGHFSPNDAGETVVRVRCIPAESDEAVAGLTELEDANAEAAAGLSAKESMRKFAGHELFIRLLVTDADSGLTVQLTHVPAAELPYRIENDTSVDVQYHQTGYESSWRMRSVKSHSTVSYAFDEPSYERKLTLIFGDKDKCRCEVTLDSVKSFPVVSFRESGSKRRRNVYLFVRPDGLARVLCLTHSAKKLSRWISPIEAKKGLESKLMEKLSGDADAISMTVRAQLRGFGLSLVDVNPRELLYVSGTDVEASLVTRKESTGMELTMNSFQIDNQLYPAIFPVLLGQAPVPPSVAEKKAARAKGKGKGKEKESSRSGLPFLHVSVVQDTRYDTVDYYQYISFALQEMDVGVDEELLMALLGMATRLSKVSGMHKTIEMEPVKSLELKEEEQEAWESHAVVGVDAAREAAVEAARSSGAIRKVFIDFLHIHPLQVNLSFELSNAVNVFHGLPPVVSLVLDTLVSTVATLDAAPVRLNSLVMTSVFASWNHLVSNITSHYTQQGMREAYKIVGAADFLGNPVGLVNTMSVGVKEFFYAPAQGIVESPMAFGRGVASGTSSLLKATVSGFSASATAMSGAAGKGLAALSMDEEYAQRRARRRRRVRVAHVGEGLQEGAKELGHGFTSGITGVFTKPVEGAKKGGFLGFGKGMAQGVAGVFTKPAAGVFDLVSRTAEGINASSTSTEDLERERDPRAFFGLTIPLAVLEHVRGMKPEPMLMVVPCEAPARLAIGAYLAEDAHGLLALHMIEEGRFSHESLVFCLYTDKHVVVGTASRIIMARAETYRLVWHYRWFQILEVMLTNVGVALRVATKMEKAGGHASSIRTEVMAASSEPVRMQLYSKATSALNRYDGEAEAEQQASRPAMRSIKKLEETRLTIVPKNKWTDDSALPWCEYCKAGFSQSRRKHHCRTCGRLTCSRCSRDSHGLPFAKGVRLCSECISVAVYMPKEKEV